MIYARPNLCYMKLCSMKGQICYMKGQIYVMLYEIMLYERPNLCLKLLNLSQPCVTQMFSFRSTGLIDFNTPKSQNKLSKLNLLF